MVMISSLLLAAALAREPAHRPPAVQLCAQAAVLDPADAEPLYLAGGIYLDLHKPQEALVQLDRKSTRLNSSHSGESRMPSSA